MGIPRTPINNFKDDLIRAYQAQIFAGELFDLIWITPQPDDLHPQALVLHF